MKKIINAYLWVEKFIPGLFFVAIFLAMLAEIGYRAFFWKSFAWSTEFCRYALVWVTFIGAVYVRRQRSHIQVLFLHEYLERNTHKTLHKILLFIVNFIRMAVATAFWFCLAYYGSRYSIRMSRFYSSAMAISQYWLYFATVICGTFAGIMEVINFSKLFSSDYKEPTKADAEDAKPEMLI